MFLNQRGNFYSKSLRECCTGHLSLPLLAIVGLCSATRTDSQLPLSAIQSTQTLDVPRCGSIQWIYTNCDVHGLETPWLKLPMQ